MIEVRSVIGSMQTHPRIRRSNPYSLRSMTPVI